MLNKLCILILTLTISLLTACGTSPTTSQKSNIRPELAKDAKEIYTILDDDYKNAKPLSQADSRKLQIFEEKYPVKGDYTPDELELLSALSSMSMSEMRDGIDKNNKQSMKEYLDGSEKAKKLLGIN